jgi:hypothetical protein
MYLGAVSQVRSDFIYWSNFLGGSIQRANLDCSGKTTLVSGQNMPIGPALDLAGARMYWGNRGDRNMYRANLDGSGQTTVLAGFGGGGLVLDRPTSDCDVESKGKK